MQKEKTSIKENFNFASDNLDAANIFLEIFNNSIFEAAFHVYKAAFFLNRIHEIKNLQDQSTLLSSWLEKVEEGQLLLPAGISLEEWKSNLRYLFDVGIHNKTSTKLTVASVEQLIINHIDILKSNLAIVQKELRREAIRVTLSNIYNLRKKILAGFAILIISYFIFARYSAWQYSKLPWSTKVYNNVNLEGAPVVIKKLPKVDYDWYDILGKTLTTDFSATFTTCFVLDADTEIIFSLGSDDGSRLKINDQELINRWWPQPLIMESKTMKIPAGIHKIEIDYFQYNVAAKIKFTMQNAKDQSFIELDENNTKPLVNVNCN